jgi:hypothetical protein
MGAFHCATLLANGIDSEERDMRNERKKKRKRICLSLHPADVPVLPEETVRIARHVSSKRKRFRLLRDEWGMQ